MFKWSQAMEPEQQPAGVSHTKAESETPFNQLQIPSRQHLTA